MARPTIFINNHVHTYNRGVDKRIIFNTSGDYARFIHTLYLSNDIEYIATNYLKRSNVESPTLYIDRQYKHSGRRLVDILCFCLMPNHYHLLLKQLVDGGVSKFMQRVNTAYTNFFNLKNERSGCLFQGKYKYKIITNERYLAYLSKYIHLNPLEIIEPRWKEDGIKNWKLANEFIENYKWSSYPNYIGQKNFSSVINKGLLGDFYKNPKEYKGFINTYLAEDLNKISIF